MRLSMSVFFFCRLSCRRFLKNTFSTHGVASKLDLLPINFENLKIGVTTLSKFTQIASIHGSSTDSSDFSNLTFLGLAGFALLISQKVNTAFCHSKDDHSSCCSAPGGRGCSPASSMNWQWIKIGQSNDFENGELKEISVHEGKHKILLARIDGRLHCTGASCPHYGAPLEKGITNKDNVICPFHDAHFDIRTGVCTNGPSLNCIPVYEVREAANGTVLAHLPTIHMPEALVAPMIKASSADKRSFVIVGAGPAGMVAVETLRQQGFQGNITLIGDEHHAPYDRTVISKNLGANVDNLVLRSEHFIQNTLGTTFLKGQSVAKVLPEEKVVLLASGERVYFDKLLIASGATPRKLNLENASARNIFYLRTVEESSQISKFAAANKRVVVIGTSFLGMETAAALSRRGATVTVIGKEKAPFESTLGAKVGEAIKKKFSENGSDGAVNSVYLEGGEIVQADAVVIAIGATPNTLFCKGDIKSTPDNYLVVDGSMRTSNENIFAAGDVTYFPSSCNPKEFYHVEHWNVAMQQARVAVKNMLNTKETTTSHTYDSVPFFSSMMFGKSLRYAGYGGSYDSVIIEGALSELKFVAYYVKNKKVVAVVTMGMEATAVAACELLKVGKMPEVKDLEFGAANAHSIERAVKAFTSN